MVATYPDLFQAASVYAGVAAGCMYSSDSAEAAWNSTCATGETILTPSRWAEIARDMYPGYKGRRPRMQVFHGSVDNVVYPQNYYESIKQWAGLFKYSTTPKKTVVDNPVSPFIKYVYGKNLQVCSPHLGSFE